MTWVSEDGTKQWPPQLDFSFHDVHKLGEEIRWPDNTAQFLIGLVGILAGSSRAPGFRLKTPLPPSSTYEDITNESNLKPIDLLLWVMLPNRTLFVKHTIFPPLISRNINYPIELLLLEQANVLAKWACRRSLLSSVVIVVVNYISYRTSPWIRRRALFFNPRLAARKTRFIVTCQNGQSLDIHISY